MSPVTGFGRMQGDDIDARRFYETRGFSNTEPGRTDALLYYYREL